MAKKVIKGAFLSLGGTDYSAQVKSATLTISASEVDVSNFATGDWSEMLVANLKGTLAIEWVKDADLSGLDAAMWTALGTDAGVTFALRVDDAAKSPTNPEFTGTVKVTTWGVGGSVGQAFGGSTSWPVSGAVTRSTS